MERGASSAVELTTGRVMTGEGVTERCGLGVRCESCGNANGDLRIKIYNILGASMCLTLGGSCASSTRAPQIMLSTAEKLVAQRQPAPCRV
jgi:hypothetical protein